MSDVLEFSDREAFRKWLCEHCLSNEGVWPLSIQSFRLLSYIPVEDANTIPVIEITHIQPATVVKNIKIYLKKFDTIFFIY